MSMTELSTTLADLADRNLRRDIVAGVLKPGEKLSIASLIKRYAIGASPLREALSRLSTDRLVVLEGKRGFTVAPISAAELDDISICRRLVETEAVRLAVEHGDETWEARVVAAFHRLDRAEERARQHPAADPVEWEQRNSEFHAAVVSACGSTWLIRLQTMLYAQHERYRRLSLLHRDPARDLRRAALGRTHRPHRRGGPCGVRVRRQQAGIPAARRRTQKRRLMQFSTIAVFIVEYCLNANQV